jgi:glycosyltransferase involved in cell wall biosynthesis
MKKNVLSHSDASERQRDMLNSLLVRSKSPASVAAPSGQKDGELIVSGTERDQTRLLFISGDDWSSGGGDVSVEQYLHLGDVFDEVHIVLLRTSNVPVRFPVLRPSSKIWLYIASAKEWWRTPLTALAIIDKQLAFAGGFRADIIIAHDPFESALVASIVSHRYHRPYQVHVQHDFYHPHFLSTNTYPRIRRRLAEYNLRRVSSVRTVSDLVTQMVHHRFPMVKDCETLPRLNRYEHALAEQVTHDIKAVYKDFSMTVVYIGSLNHNNLVHQVIDGVRPLCKEKGIGLCIIGAGPAKSELQKRVKRLGLERYIVFESSVTKQTDYLRTADILIVTDTSSASDTLVLQAAVFSVATMATPTTFRVDLFEHNASMLFFEPGKSAMITTQLRELTDDKNFVSQLARQARAVVSARLYTTPDEYRQAYRTSIERVLFIDDGEPGAASSTSARTTE